MPHGATRLLKRSGAEGTGSRHIRTASRALASRVRALGKHSAWELNETCVGRRACSPISARAPIPAAAAATRPSISTISSPYAAAVSFVRRALALAAGTRPKLPKRTATTSGPRHRVERPPRWDPAGRQRKHTARETGPHSLDWRTRARGAKRRPSLLRGPPSGQSCCRCGLLLEGRCNRLHRRGGRGHARRGGCVPWRVKRRPARGRHLPGVVGFRD